MVMHTKISDSCYKSVWIFILICRQDLKNKMGANSSSFSELSTNEQLKYLSGTESITPNDPFWNQLLSFSFVAPRNR